MKFFPLCAHSNYQQPLLKDILRWHYCWILRQPLKKWPQEEEIEEISQETLYESFMFFPLFILNSSGEVVLDKQWIFFNNMFCHLNPKGIS